MTKIVYDKRNHKVTIKGHAGSAPNGEDLVCSAVSILTYTLEANAVDLQKKGYARFVSAKLNDGDSEIVCIPKCRYEAGTDLIISSVCVGYELLSKRYPEFVTYEIKC